MEPEVSHRVVRTAPPPPPEPPMPDLVIVDEPQMIVSLSIPPPLSVHHSTLELYDSKRVQNVLLYLVTN